MFYVEYDVDYDCSYERFGYIELIVLDFVYMYMYLYNYCVCKIQIFI